MKIDYLIFRKFSKIPMDELDIKSRNQIESM